MRKPAEKAVRSRTKSVQVLAALEVLNQELLFVVQSRELGGQGDSDNVWFTHTSLGDWKDDGTIQGKDVAYWRMEEEKSKYEPRQWRVLQRDNLVFYQEGVRDRKKRVKFPQPRRLRLALPDTMQGDL